MKRYLSIIGMGIDLTSFASVGIPVLLVLLLPVLRVRSARKRLALIIFSLYLAAVASLVGLPSISHLVFDPTVCLLPFAGLKEGLKERILNIILFLPFGFLLPVIWERFRALLPTAIAGFLFSLAIELSQLFTFRVTDINDLIGNTLGAILGFLLASAASRRIYIQIREQSLLPWENGGDCHRRRHRSVSYLPHPVFPSVGDGDVAACPAWKTGRGAFR